MNNIRVRLPRKLAKSVSGGVLAEEGRLNPVGAMGITLNMLPVHRVTMTLSENDLPLAMHDLVEVYNHKGSVGIYRVTKITGAVRKNRKFDLSHGLDVLSDSSFDMIEEYKGTVDGMLAKIINAQTQTIGGVKYWQLGTCADTNPWNKNIKYDNLMECLTEIARKEEDYMFTFDQSTFPWTLNFVARNNDVLSEFRLNRNTENCVITEDDADLCTRLYLSVTSETNDDEGNGTYIDEGYFTYNDTDAQNAGFGVVCKTAGVNQEDFASQAALEAWVAAYFGRHNRPGVQITLDGVELNRLTGENIDEVHLSRICRVALPEYRCTFNERIVSVNYPDALRKPLYVRNSLANKRQTAEDAFSEIKNTATSASKSAGGAGRAAHNDATYFRRIIGDTANGLYSRIEQTAYYIRSEVFDTANNLYSRIEQTASYIRSEVADTANGLESKIEQTASAIRSEVSDTANGLNSRITQTASSWEAKISGVTGSDGKVTAASIAVAINSAGEGVATINASKIYLLGQTIADQITADYIATKIATLSSLTVNSIACSGTIGANELQVGTLKFRSSSGSGYSFSDLKDLFVTSVEVSGPVNNVYTLKYYTANNTTGTSGGTFSRAVSSFTGTWSGNHYQVTVSPQNQTGGDTYLFTSADDWTDEHKKTVHVYYFSGGNPVDVLTPVIDAGSVYTEGFEAGEGQFTRQTITLQGSQTSDITIQGAAATTTTVTLQGSQTASLTLQGEAQTVYEEVSSGGTVYYTAGTAKTYYDAGTAGTYYDAGTAVTVYPGNGGSFTPQGSAGPRLKDDGSARHYDVNGNLIGNHHWYHAVSSGGTQYYYAGSGTKYARGTGYSITPIGTAHIITPVGAGHVVTPIGSTSKRLSAVTRYKAGTNVGKLYNAGSVATYYPATATLYKAGTNIGKLYNAGTISTDYYTKA